MQQDIICLSRMQVPKELLKQWMLKSATTESTMADGTSKSKHTLRLVHRDASKPTALEEEAVRQACHDLQVSRCRHCLCYCICCFLLDCVYDCVTASIITGEEQDANHGWPCRTQVS